jgi:anion-transporting  ArsA/GET3 family ATPase
VTAPSSFSALLHRKRVVLSVGCGGVGKTTTSAALGVAAALAGQRVLCLTIDPARRLSQSLGLTEMTVAAQTIAPELLAQIGVKPPGSLTVMRVDTKSTFDGLVRQLAPDEKSRERIFSNVVYRYVSTSLAGTQEYMAMEKLYALKDDPAYDVIILDTPPTTNALDFLDAPERLVGAIDSQAMRWFVQSVQGGSKFSLNLLARAAAATLKGVSKLTGSGFLEQIATFVGEINTLFGGWKARAEIVSSALRGPDVAYILVTTPDPLALREVRFFADRLRKDGMRPSGFVINRVHPAFDGDADPAAIGAELEKRGVKHVPPGDLAQQVQRAKLDASKEARRDRLHLMAVDDIFEDDPALIRVEVPAWPADLHDLEALAKVARILAS